MSTNRRVVAIINKKVFFIALFTVTGWGSAFAAIRVSLLAGISPGHLLLFRYLTASLVFVLYAIYTRDQFRLPKKEDILHIFVLSFIGITCYQFGITFGQQTVSAGVAGMIIGSAPIATTLIAVIILKEKMEGFGWIGLGIGFIGMCLITVGTSNGGFYISPGLFLVFFAMISTSIFFVYQKALFKKYKPIELTAYFTWFGTIPMLVFSPGLIDNITSVSLEAQLAAVYVGVVPAAFCYATWAIALSLGNVSTVSSMIYLEPLIAIIVAWIWLQELPSGLSLIGGFIAISSVAIVNIVGRKKRERSPG